MRDVSKLERILLGSNTGYKLNNIIFDITKFQTHFRDWEFSGNDIEMALDPRNTASSQFDDIHLIIAAYTGQIENLYYIAHHRYTLTNFNHLQTRTIKAGVSILNTSSNLLKDTIYCFNVLRLMPSSKKIAAEQNISTATALDTLLEQSALNHKSSAFLDNFNADLYKRTNQPILQTYKRILKAAVLSGNIATVDFTLCTFKNKLQQQLYPTGSLISLDGDTVDQLITIASTRGGLGRPIDTAYANQVIQSINTQCNMNIIMLRDTKQLTNQNPQDERKPLWKQSSIQTSVATIIPTILATATSERSSLLPTAKQICSTYFTAENVYLPFNRHPLIDIMMSAIIYGALSYGIVKTVSLIIDKIDTYYHSKS